jgi:hypothetical protein
MTARVFHPLIESLIEGWTHLDCSGAFARQSERL